MILHIHIKNPFKWLLKERLIETGYTFGYGQTVEFVVYTHSTKRRTGRHRLILRAGNQPRLPHSEAHIHPEPSAQAAPGRGVRRDPTLRSRPPPSASPGRRRRGGRPGGRCPPPGHAAPRRGVPKWLPGPNKGRGVRRPRPRRSGAVRTEGPRGRAGSARQTNGRYVTPARFNPQLAGGGRKACFTRDLAFPERLRTN